MVAKFFAGVLCAAVAFGRVVEAKAVFAHYMLGTITEDHAHQDIDDAMAMGFDGFALNVGDSTLDFVATSLSHLFGYAEYVGFKLYISMDLYAAGDACYNGAKSCNGLFDYQWIWDAHKGSSAYYTINGKALISTFSSGGLHNDTFIDWKNGLGNDLYFCPDIDETLGYYEAAEGWWEYWGPIVDCIFSWETAWPERDGRGAEYPGDVSVDVPVLTGAHKRNKEYMMGLSPLQYKDSYGANVYRPGDLNMPKRMVNILNMDPQPDFVQFQTWNDGPESHYIGGIWPESNTDPEPHFYATQENWPHQGWQPLVASWIQAYKNGLSFTDMQPIDGSIAQGAAWYKTIFTDVECPYDGEAKYYNKPDGFTDGANYLYWSLVLSPDAPTGYTVEVEGGDGTHVQHLTQGLNMGYGAGTISKGAQRVLLKDPSGNVIMTATGGMCVSDGCPSLIYNSNYQVLPFQNGEKDASCKEWPQTSTDCGSSDCKGTVPVTGDDWKYVTCTNPGVTDAAKDGPFRWNSVYAEETWSWAVSEWNSGSKSLPFPEQISNLFHGPEYFDCHIFEDDNPCGSRVVECDDVTYPGQYLILNSFTALYRATHNFFKAIKDSRDDIVATIGTLSGTFAPIPKGDLTLELTMDLVSLGFSLAVSPMWNKWLKTIPYFKNDANKDDLGVYKDWVNPIVTNTITIIKDSYDGDSRLTTENEVAERLEAMVSIWEDSMDTMNKQLFDGSDTSVDNLHEAIKDGHMLESSHTDLDTLEVREIVKKAMFATIIPYTWQIGTQDVGPVIIDSQTACGDTFQSLYIDEDDMGTTGLCVEGTMYYLVGAWGDPNDCRVGEGGGTYCYANTFSVLPGWNSLDGDNWGGLTHDDFIIGAVNVYKANNNANGWQILDPTNLGDAMDLILDLDVRAPGVINIPVCTEDEAFDNWLAHQLDETSKNYPCN